MSLRRVLVFGLAAALIPAAAMASVYPRDNMESGAGWTVMTQSADASATFGWNYGAMGIPEAPNSVVGPDAATTGLKFTANESAVAADVVTALPGVSCSGQFTVQFDMWINANGPFPGGGAGSTEFLGGGVGHDGVTNDRNGALLIVDGEGGSGSDWRLYKNTGLQYPASGQYAIDTNNNTGVDLSAHIPAGKTPPAYQVTNYPQQTGSLAAGTAGFEWVTMVIDADSDAGTAKFTMTTSAGPIVIGTLNSNIGSAVAIAGEVALYYADLFTSVSDNAALSFGLIDNFSVVPEPMSLLLLGLGGLALLRRRR